ncbi:MAG: hypothetical protein OEM46_05280 [Ignavibacteria bacterium]|nr:hypothetical protein [Ignavibacteria bacterium]
MASQANLGTLIVDLVLNSAEFKRRASQAQKNVSELEKKINKSLNKINRLGTGIASFGKTLTKSFTLPVLLAGGALVAFAKKAGDYVDRIDKAAYRTGLTRAELQKLSFVADQTGAQFESLVKGTTTLQKAMYDASRGLSTARDAFADIGVGIYNLDGTLKTTSDLFPELISRLQAMEDTTKRNALAMTLFGSRAGRDLIPLLSKGVDVKKLTDQFVEMGGVIDDDLIKAGVNFVDTFNRVKMVLEAVVTRIGLSLIPFIEGTLIPLLENDLIPALDKMVKLTQIWGNAFKKFTPEAKAVGTKLAGIAILLPPIILLVGKIISIFAKAGKSIVAAIGWIARTAVTKVSLIGSAIAGLAAIIYIIIRDFEVLRKFASAIWDQLVIDFTGGISKIAQVAAEVFRVTSPEVAAFLDSISAKMIQTAAQAKQSFSENPFNNWDRVVGEMAKNMNADFDSILKKIGLIGDAVPEQTEKLKTGTNEATTSVKGLNTELAKTGVYMGDLGAHFESGVFKQMKEDLDGINSAINNLSMSAFNFGQIIDAWAVNTLEATQSFVGSMKSAVIEGGAGIKQLGNIVLDEAKKFIRAKIAEGVAAHIASTLSSVPFPFGIIAAGLAASAATALFNTWMNKLLPMAQGGIVTSPTAILAGEAGPEIIFPLSDLKRFMSSDRQEINVTVASSIYGEDIRLSQIRTTKKQNRFI